MPKSFVPIWKPKIENSKFSGTPHSKIQNLKPKIETIQKLKSKTHHSSYPPSEGTFSQEDILASRLRVTKVLPFQQASPPFVSNLFLSVISGLLLVFAFPNWGLWSLGWVGVAPLLMAVAREQKFWPSLSLGWTTGTIFYLGTSYWVTYSMNNYGGIPLWISYLIALLIAAIFGSFTALFAGIFAQTIKAFGGWAILSAPVLWVATEWLRLQITGVGWNALGYSQAFQATLIQTAKFGGVYLVSAFLVVVSTATVFGIVYLGYRRAIVVLAISFGLVILVLLNSRSQSPAKPPTVRVVTIQPNIPINGNWEDEKFVEQLILRHINLSEQALEMEAHNLHLAPGEPKGEPVQLVIWPESPMAFQYERDEKLRKQLAQFTTRNRVYLLMNSWGEAKAGDAPEATYNSVMLINPSGELINRYDKLALMPFGEYVPARGWIPFMDKIPALVADVTPGKQFILSEVSGARIGTMICFEITRPDIARRFRNDGASQLVQSSNESWFGPTPAARQLLAQAVFRAVENNIDLTRITNSGLSAGITRYGDIVDEAPMFQTATQAWNFSTVEEADPATFYTRYGDVFAVTCTILSAALAIAAVIYERMKKEDEEE